MANKRWNLQEVEYIKKMYAVRTIKEIAMHLNLTEVQVECTLRRYRIRKKPRVYRDPDLAGMLEHIEIIRKELGIN